jgi:hypothetical protein
MANTDAKTAVPDDVIDRSINDNGARDEESPLLPRPDTEPKLKPLPGVATIIAVLLLGKKIPNAGKETK